MSNRYAVLAEDGGQGPGDPEADASPEVSGQNPQTKFLLEQSVPAPSGVPSLNGAGSSLTDAFTPGVDAASVAGSPFSAAHPRGIAVELDAARMEEDPEPEGDDARQQALHDGTEDMRTGQLSTQTGPSWDDLVRYDQETTGTHAVELLNGRTTPPAGAIQPGKLKEVASTPRKDRESESAAASRNPANLFHQIAILPRRSARIGEGGIHPATGKQVVGIGTRKFTTEPEAAFSAFTFSGASLAPNQTKDSAQSGATKPSVQAGTAGKAARTERAVKPSQHQQNRPFKGLEQLISRSVNMRQRR
ncbi:hypothetical protein V8E36_004310 [Tilletia maclaganii]